tara:strand:+ start:321 stop:494 length:174 start_codon:yes stop_codon:yes gene_type:complete
MEPLQADLDTMISAINRWKNEARNFRNDGWVQQSYLEKLKKIFVESGKALSELKNDK